MAQQAVTEARQRLARVLQAATPAGQQELAHAEVEAARFRTEWELKEAMAQRALALVTAPVPNQPDRSAPVPTDSTDGEVAEHEPAATTAGAAEEGAEVEAAREAQEAAAKAAQGANAAQAELEKADQLVADLANATTDDPAEAIAALLDAKRGANDAWLRRLGRYGWGAAILAALIITWVVQDEQGMSTAEQTITTHLEAIARQWAEATEVLGGAEGDLDPAQIAVLDALTTDIVGRTEDIESGLTLVPRSWNRSRLDGELLELGALTVAVRSAATDLSTEANQGSPDAALMSDAIRGGESSTLTARSIDLSPGVALPWNFRQPAVASLLYALFFVLAVLAAISLLFRHSGGIRSFLIGGDARLSTSQTQAALWTVGVLFMATALLLRDAPGRFDELDESYLLLLGGPFAAWVVSGAITRGKLDNETIQKVTGVEAQVKDLIGDDDGRANLTDAQFFVFSSLALMGVLIAFLRNPSSVPEIPAGLVMLTTAAALVYTGKKALDKNAPVVYSASLASGQGEIKIGSTISIQGANFVPPGAGGDLEVLSGVVVRFSYGEKVYDKPVRPTPVPGDVKSAKDVRRVVTNPREDQILVDVPTVDVGPVGIVVITAAGAKSNTETITVS